MILPIIQQYKKILPKIKGVIFKRMYGHSNFKIGKNFKCDSFPNVTIDKTAKITIDDNVFFRRNVEIRAHNSSSINIEKDVRLDRGIRILAANNSNINIGEGSRIGLYSVFNGGDNIILGKQCLVSGFVYLQTSIHNHNKNEPIQNQGYTHRPITIENDVWIGAHSMVLPGVTIREGAIIGANSVVNRKVKKHSVSLGVPITYVKERTFDNDKND